MSNAVATTNNAPMSYEQLERMAITVAKTGFFPCKRPEEALTLMLVAQSEGIHPMQAMMEYDVISGKPCLKAHAMLARFQRAGGTVKWLESTDERVSGTFSHPSGGSLTTTWDTARVTQAGLMRNALHKTNPQQMKRARCMSEGIKAVCPGCIPAGLYPPEETIDIEGEATAVVTAEHAVQEAGKAIVTRSEADELMTLISEAADYDALKAVYGPAYKEAKAAKDQKRMDSYSIAYQARKAELETPAIVVADTAAETAESVI